MNETRGSHHNDSESLSSDHGAPSDIGSSPPEVPRPARRAYIRRRIHEEAYGIRLRLLEPSRYDMSQSGVSRPDLSPYSHSNHSGRQSQSKIGAVKDNDARSFFDIISSCTPCVFLCTGQPEACKIVQVPLRDEDDDAAILDKMRSTWAESRRWLPCRRVTRVEEVVFRFAGAEDCKGNSVLFGTYECVDITQLRRSLDERSKAVVQSITKWQGQNLIESCRENYTSGEWEHSTECPVRLGDFHECDVQEFDMVQRRLRSLSLLPVLTLAFQNPSLAKGQRLLDGLSSDPGKYSSRDMLRNLYWHNPRIGDIAFNGYKVTEEWEDVRRSAALPLAFTLTVGSAFIFRVVFGDWQTAIGASSLVVTAMALMIQWMVYLTGKY